MNWHPFHKELWRIEDERYLALEQSFRLSARLLLVGPPGFICNFLPKPQRLGFRDDEKRSALFPRNKLHMRWALHHLRTEVLPNVRFSEDADIWPDANVMSLAHTGLAEATKSDIDSRCYHSLANHTSYWKPPTILSNI